MTLLGRTVRRLVEASSPTALIGGIALAVHGITRYTEDADPALPSSMRESWAALPSP